MDLRGPRRSALWAEWAELAFRHIFLCSLYLRSSLPCTLLSPLPHLSQIVLAFGNYMNSSKRGAAYGFRLQSLDVVRGTRRGSLARGMGSGGGPWLTTGLHAAAGDEVH